MVIAGALAGLAGCLRSWAPTAPSPSTSTPAIGFDAITVALLGLASPGGIVRPGCCSARCGPAACRPAGRTRDADGLVQVMQAVIVLFIAAPGLIRVIFRLRDSRGGGVAAAREGMERMTADRRMPPGPTDELVVTRTVVELGLSRRQRAGCPARSILLAGLITIFAWGVGAKPGDAAFPLSQFGDKVHIPDHALPGRGRGDHRAVRSICGSALWQLSRGFLRARARSGCCSAVVGCCSCRVPVLGRHRLRRATRSTCVGLLQTTLFLAVPLILGRDGRHAVRAHRRDQRRDRGADARRRVRRGAGRRRMAHNLGVGVVAAIVAGGLFGALLAVFAIKFVVNQVVLGVVINVLALGAHRLRLRRVDADAPGPPTTPGLVLIRD